MEKEWAKLLDPDALEVWLNDVQKSDWNVFIEGPPHGKSDPAQVLKYLAAYRTGGPISNGRMIRDDDDRVTFWARSKNKHSGSWRKVFEREITNWKRMQ